MLTAEKASLEGKLDYTSMAQREAQSQVAALDKEVSMLRQQLADAEADAQRRLGQLEVKLADAEQAKKELTAPEAEVLRKLEEEAKAELAAERSQRAALREELAALQARGAQAGQCASAKASALQKQVEMLTAEKTSLEGKLALSDQPAQLSRLSERLGEELRGFMSLELSDLEHALKCKLAEFSEREREWPQMLQALENELLAAKAHGSCERCAAHERRIRELEHELCATASSTLVMTDPLHTSVQDRCNWCRLPGSVEVSLMQCSACKVVVYCSQDCQREAWPSHVLECQALRGSPLRETELQTDIRSLKERIKSLETELQVARAQTPMKSPRTVSPVFWIQRSVASSPELANSGLSLATIDIERFEQAMPIRIDDLLENNQDVCHTARQTGPCFALCASASGNGWTGRLPCRCGERATRSSTCIAPRSNWCSATTSGMQQTGRSEPTSLCPPISFAPWQRTSSALLNVFSSWA
jgi:hypothetical protein